MASIKKREDGRYRARYRDAAGKEHAQHFERKTDAQRWLDEVTASVVRGDYVDPGRGRVTVGEWSGPWLAGRAHLKPKTLHSYQALLRTRVLPTWEHVPLTSVSHADIVAWVAKMRAGGAGPSLVRQAFYVLSSMLDSAVSDRRIPSNPAAGVKLPRLVKSERRYLTHAQLAQLADGCGDHRTFVLLLGYCGLRWGEAAALKVRNVDLLRRRLEIVAAMTEVGGVATYGTPKTHQRRSVPVPAFLIDALAREIAGRAPDALAFPSPHGGVLRSGNFRRNHFDAAATRAGLEGLTLHELRHTAASLAISAGANVKAVQQMLGHASAAMTLNVYGGLFPDDLDAVADRLDEAARAAAEISRTNRGLDVVPLDSRRSG
jgi:integrase